MPRPNLFWMSLNYAHSPHKPLEQTRWQAWKNFRACQRWFLDAGSPGLDAKTRSMPVELDVINKEQTLGPGMYSTVHWPVRSAEPALFVPKTSVVTTTERTFVVRDKNGRAEWVNVQKGAADGDLIRVIGPLQDGDRVVKRATDEMREGMDLKTAAK